MLWVLKQGEVGVCSAPTARGDWRMLPDAIARPDLGRVRVLLFDGWYDITVHLATLDDCRVTEASCWNHKIPQPLNKLPQFSVTSANNGVFTQPPAAAADHCRSLRRRSSSIIIEPSSIKKNFVKTYSCRKKIIEVLTKQFRCDVKATLMRRCFNWAYKI